MTESEFWKELRKGFNRKKVGFQRIEDRYSQGVPDLCVFHNGATQWIELKRKIMPERKTTVVKLGLRDRQLMWHKKRYNEGVRVLVVSLCEAKDSLDNFFLVHDNSVVDRVHEGMTTSELVDTGEVFFVLQELINYLTDSNLSKL